MTPYRVALYWAPERSDPLDDLGSLWLGRDAQTGGPMPQPEIPDLDIAELTADPRLYGLHATLKPPFRPAGPYAAILDRAVALAGRIAAFDLPPLSVQDLHGFLALRETAPCPALQAFADECVAALDDQRAPPTPEEIARRRPERLTPAQRGLLARWGYPYVFGEWQFHVTLTRRLTAEERAVVRPAVTRFLRGVEARPRRVTELCLFAQPAPGAPFTIAERLPLLG